MLLGLVSAKASPGVTTAALALTAVAEDGLLVELDPSGGSIECWTSGGAHAFREGLSIAIDAARDVAWCEGLQGFLQPRWF